MAKPPIVVASDHRGVRLKGELRDRLEAEGHEVLDIGTQGDESVDYPEFAAPAARAVSEGKNERAIVICGSGLGVMYTANRFPGCALRWRTIRRRRRWPAGTTTPTCWPWPRTASM